MFRFYSLFLRAFSNRSYHWNTSWVGLSGHQVCDLASGCLRHDLCKYPEI